MNIPIFEAPAPIIEGAFSESHSGAGSGMEGIAALAHGALLSEVHTWPKPGLVSHIDCGSHCDMDYGTFAASADSLLPYFHGIAMAGAQGADMQGLRVLGLQAECAMLKATRGVNTHRGAIFGLGLLCAAAGYRRSAGASDALGEIVARRWGHGILGIPRPTDSHGTSTLLRYGAGGARAEAAAGFPNLYRIALPALRQARMTLPDDTEAQRVQVLFALLAEVQDTNLLHRGGPSGSLWAQTAARAFLDSGGVFRGGWREDAAFIHRQFIAR
jgi:triphosphoribosyl-dephospho-CoA synthase